MGPLGCMLVSKMLNSTEPLR